MKKTQKFAFFLHPFSREHIKEGKKKDLKMTIFFVTFFTEEKKGEKEKKVKLEYLGVFHTN